MRRSGEALLFSAVFSAFALGLFWVPQLAAPAVLEPVYWPNPGILLLLLVQREIMRHSPDRYPVEPVALNALLLISGVSLWRFVSLWVLQGNASGYYLTASWSLLALGLFTCGIVLQERLYRWLGLGILASALARVALIDVWRLEALYRILSLLALGVVLLVLGFIYSKYQEKIKEWL
jgi:uncharacterized membrane protein